ncbi:hypothetical protein ACN082_09840 [Rothia sp. CCM 9417]|uniref:hypothetical protein n=1 Tax=Rothia sp. CCM 9417 TaxID=3402657 RepID=UPI003AE6C9E4
MTTQINFYKKRENIHTGAKTWATHDVQALETALEAIGCDLDTPRCGRINRSGEYTFVTGGGYEIASDLTQWGADGSTTYALRKAGYTVAFWPSKRAMNQATK